MNVVEYSAEIMGECFNFSHQIQRNAWHIDNSDLLSPVRIDAFMRCRTDKRHELLERNNAISSFRKRWINATARCKI